MSCSYPNPFLPHAFVCRIVMAAAIAMRFVKPLILTVMTLAPCPAQQMPDAAISWLQFIGQELSQIRVELLEQQTVEEAGRLAGLQRELEALQTLQAQHQSEDPAQKQQFVRAVTEKLLTYSLGRGIEYYDAPAIRGIVRGAAVDDYRWSSVVLGIVKSAPFQMRRSGS